jgi:adenine/guanine phosphoribosyltransferase-like PRPP-binding protein
MGHIHSDYLACLFDRNRFQTIVKIAKVELNPKKFGEFDAFVVTGNSGTIFGGVLAMAMKKNLILVRKPSDDGHSCYKVEGDMGSKSYVFLDDFIGSGATFKRTTEKMIEEFPNCQMVGTYEYTYTRATRHKSFMEFMKGERGGYWG